ncbi:MAG: LamG-like jellyroll fold domain-containing protein, partial [Acidobacteriota bacterium]
TGTSPYDGVITGGSVAHTLEGGAALAGQHKPAIEGYGANVPAFPVAPEFGVYQIADHTTMGPFGASERLRLPPGVYDRLSPLALEGIETDLLDFFAASPSIGGYIWYPPLSLFRVGGSSDGSIFTASLWGRADWRGGAYFDGVDDSVLLKEAPGQALDGAAWTLEAYVYLHDDIDGDAVLFDRRQPDGSGGIRVTYRNIPDLGRVVETSLGTDGGPRSRWLAGRQVGPGRPFHFAWSVSSSGGSVTETWWVNGRRYASQPRPGVTPGAGLTGLRVGRLHGAAVAHAPMVVSDIRIWSEARTDAQVRDFYLRSPRGAAGLAHYMPMETDLGMWAGLAVPGEARATWTGGVPMSELTAIVARQLADADGVETGLLDVEHALATLPDAPLSATVSGSGKTRIQIIDEVRRSLGAALVRDHAGDCWCLRQHRDPRAELNPKRLRPDDVGEV